MVSYTRTAPTSSGHHWISAVGSRGFCLFFLVSAQRGPICCGNAGLLVQLNVDDFDAEMQAYWLSSMWALFDCRNAGLLVPAQRGRFLM
jgi:hypothetical protein